jgi:hypothetical protein
MNFLAKPLAAILILSLLSLTACSGSAVVSDIAEGVTVAEGVVPLVLALVPGGAAFAVPVQAFLTTAVTGLNAVSVVLQQTGLTALQVTEKISAALAATIAQTPGIQSLLSGAPAEIASAVAQIIAIVAQIVTNYGTHAVTASVRTVAQTAYWEASRKDDARLVSIHQRCETLLKQLPSQ